MSRLRRMFTDKVFLRLFSLFLATMLLSFSLILAELMVLAQRMRTEQISAIQTQVHDMLDDLEAEINMVMNIMRDHIVYDDIMGLSVNYAALSPYERSVQIRNIQNTLSFIKNRSSYFSDIRCNLHVAGRSIGQIGQIDPIDEPAIAVLRGAQNRTGGMLLEHDGELHLFVQYPSASGRRGKEHFSVDVLLDTSHIERDILSFVGEGGLYSLDFSGLGVQYNLANAQAQDGAPREGLLVRHGGQPYYRLDATSLNGLLDLSVFIPAQRFRYHINALPAMVALLVVLFALLALLYSGWLRRYISRPIRQLIDGFFRLEKGEFGVALSSTANDEFQEIFACFNRVSSHLGTLMRQTVEQALLTKNAQLRQLEAQINPHFLYNSFFLLSSMLHQGDMDTACSYAHLLGRYYQYVTRNDGTDISLEAEVEHARAYAQIQARRFEGRIRVIFPPLPQGYGRIMVPRIILQPLVENAFEHGLRDKTSRGVVRLAYALQEGKLYISVDDNGPGLDAAQMRELAARIRQADGQATGVLNIGRRLLLKYGQESRLAFSKSELGGLRVVLCIPVRAQEQADAQTPREAQHV